MFELLTFPTREYKIKIKECSHKRIECFLEIIINIKQLSASEEEANTLKECNSVINYFKNRPNLDFEAVCLFLSAHELEVKRLVATFLQIAIEEAFLFHAETNEII